MSVGKLSLGVFRNGSNYSLIDYIIFATICKIVAKKKVQEDCIACNTCKKYKRITLYICASQNMLSAAAIKKEAKIIGIQEQQMCYVGMTTATSGLESWEGKHA